MYGMPTASAARMPPFSPHRMLLATTLWPRRPYTAASMAGPGAACQRAVSHVERRSPTTNRTTNTAASTAPSRGRPVSGEVASRQSLSRRAVVRLGDHAARERASGVVPLARDAQRPPVALGSFGHGLDGARDFVDVLQEGESHGTRREPEGRRLTRRPREPLLDQGHFLLDLFGVAAASPRPVGGPLGHLEQSRLQLRHSLPGRSHSGDDGYLERPRQRLDVDLQRPAPGHVHQVQGDDDRKTEVEQLQDDVQVAGHVRGVDHYRDDVRVIDQQMTAGRPLIVSTHSPGAHVVGPGEIDDPHRPAPPESLLGRRADRHAGVVRGLDGRAGQLVEEAGLAYVGVAGQTDDEGVPRGARSSGKRAAAPGHRWPYTSTKMVSLTSRPSAYCVSPTRTRRGPPKGA